jgi:hypothetical protein
VVTRTPAGRRRVRAPWYASLICWNLALAPSSPTCLSGCHFCGGSRADELRQAHRRTGERHELLRSAPAPAAGRPPESGSRSPARRGAARVSGACAVANAASADVARRAERRPPRRELQAGRRSPFSLAPPPRRACPAWRQAERAQLVVDETRNRRGLQGCARARHVTAPAQRAAAQSSVVFVRTAVPLARARLTADLQSMMRARARARCVLRVLAGEVTAAAAGRSRRKSSGSGCGAVAGAADARRATRWHHLGVGTWQRRDCARLRQPAPGAATARPAAGCAAQSARADARAPSCGCVRVVVQATRETCVGSSPLCFHLCFLFFLF